jgi:selenide,water dikinase
MAAASKVTIRVEAEHIEVLRGAVECVQAGYIPGGLKSNREFAESCVSYAGKIPEDLKTLLYDPQTAGGLLLSVPSEIAKGLIAAMEVAGVAAVRVGEVLPESKKLIELI